MARRKGRRGGSNRRGLLVRDVTYAQPISEPANFVEFTLLLNPSTPITWGALFTELTTNHVISNSINKWRVSSIVVDPVHQNTTTGPITQSEIHVWDGQRYQFSDVNKPLRVRFKNAVGSTGMWLKGAPSGTSEVFPNFPVADQNFVQLDSGSPTGVGTEVSFRIAYTDVATAS